MDEALVYDVMGNITGLTRGGQAYGALSYSYSGNQLNGVTGTSFTTRSYAYDGNGNATSDGGSKSIDYNILNLPRKVSAGTTELANYTYDASGNKLSNVSTSAGANDGTWEYIGGIVYHNGSVAFIATEEGRAVPNGSDYTYQYNLKDHLGNDRLSFYSNGGTATVLQEDEYYSFGLRRGLYDNSNNNRYLYNGKEIQTDLANQYDYGARFYDPVIGRWTANDKMADHPNQIDKSPYAYGWNNPTNLTDPDGNCPMCIPLIVWAIESGAAYFAGAAVVTTVVVHNATSNGGYRSTNSSDDAKISEPSPTRFGKDSFAMDIASRRLRQAQEKKDDGQSDNTGENSKNKNDNKAGSGTPRKKSPGQLRKEWEQGEGQPWPKEPDNSDQNQVAHHKVPLADQGLDGYPNIEPKTRKDHTEHHKNNGDFKRWRQRRDPKN